MPQHKSMCLCVHQRSQRQAARAAVFECSSVRQSSALSAPVPALPSARHHTDSAAAAGEGNLCAPHETGKPSTPHAPSPSLPPSSSLPLPLLVHSFLSFLSSSLFSSAVFNLFIFLSLPSLLAPLSHLASRGARALQARFYSSSGALSSDSAPASAFFALSLAALVRPLRPSIPLPPSPLPPLAIPACPQAPL